MSRNVGNERCTNGGGAASRASRYVNLDLIRGDGGGVGLQIDVNRVDGGNYAQACCKTLPEAIADALTAAARPAVVDDLLRDG